MLDAPRWEEEECKVSSLVTNASASGSLINQYAVAVLTNYVQALAAPITTQANRSPEESRRREFAHLDWIEKICASGLDREDWVIENTTTKPIPTLKWSLASLPPFWRAIAANSVASETLHWVPSSLGSNRGVFSFSFFLRILVGVSDRQIINGWHWKVAYPLRF
jgi:hypothetical protein